MDVNSVDGFHTRSHPLKPGIYAPVPTFFLPSSEDLDIPAFQTHVARVAIAGIGPLIAGSMGEATHLSHAERVGLIQAGRKALDNAGCSHVPIIVGTGAGSTRETVELTNEAAAAGADYALVIASGYFAGALTRGALKDYWVEVSQKSSIPVMIYNYPAASGGIDLDSDLIADLAVECPNICGVKLTCGNVGKLTRIAAVVADPAFTPRKNPQAPFLVLGGYADFIFPSSFVNGHGAITGLANVAPYSIAKLFELSEASRKDSSVLPEAQRLQGIIARGDYTLAKASIAGTKFILEKLHGYGGLPRRPLPPISANAAEELWNHPHIQALIGLEREFSSKTKG